MPETYDFNRFHLDVAEHRLLRDGRPVALSPKAFDLLLDLVQHPDRLREKAQLMAVLWPDTFVEEVNLAYTVSALRKALGDERADPKYIETVPTKGYRFVAAVTATSDEASVAAPPSPTDSRGRVFRWGMVAGVAAVVAVASFAGFVASQRAPRSPAISSLAVLPLAGEPGQPEYFADGVTEELISEIGRSAQLRKVINRQSVMRFRRSTRSAADIGHELAVDALLTGTVARSGGRVRVTAQLVSTRDERVLWSGAFERSMPDVLTLQRELVRDVVATLGIALLEGAGRQPPPVDPAAYDSYLRGLDGFAHYTRQSLGAAQDDLRQATRRSPGFARAHGVLAFAVLHGGHFGVPEFPGPVARDEIRTALALDDAVPEAHAANGMLLDEYDWDWKGAEEAHRRALRLDPNSSLVRMALAHHLGMLGRYPEALVQAARAVELDPASAAAEGEIFWASLVARRFDDCVQHGTRVVAMLTPEDQARGLAQALTLFCSARLGKVDAVCADIPETPLCGLASVAAGDGGRAHRLLARACADMRQPGGPADPWCLQLAAALGDREPLLDMVEQTVAHREPYAAFFLGPTIYDYLEDEPRFRRALSTIGLR